MQTALIKSSASPVRLKMFGQFLIERNIRILYYAGFKKILLNFTTSDTELFEKKIKRKISSLKNLSISFTDKNPKEAFLELTTNYFLYLHAFSDESNFIKKNRTITLNPKSFYDINDRSTLKTAEKHISEYIRHQSGGVVAQTINKRISIPLSRLLSRVGVHPNVITLANYALGLFGVYLLLDTSHSANIAAGLIIQAVSIIDGCDGEVARMKTRFSKLGGILDTVCDHTLAILIIAAATRRVYMAFSVEIFIVIFSMIALGVIAIIGWNTVYLIKYSSSYSFSGFSKEFLSPLSKTSFLAKLISILQYCVRKEVYSLSIMFFCFFNAIVYYTFLFAVFGLVGFFLVNILCIKYFPSLKKQN
ncbi:MAG: CDP-alcohol phosphatidyltransferase family protein [Spirochaetes bacterium]|nr:CDP-alcohol phosphatidyltransferase family protein [Spirochaetota bacterium]